MSGEWRSRHREVINGFLQELNSGSDSYILKGGTALLTCYNLDRFSEDIDLDGTDPNIEKYVTAFCADNGFTYRTAKDTPTVKRFMVKYDENYNPLKVEISYRRTGIDPAEIRKIDGINVYCLDSIAAMKASAYAGRDRIRDLHDLAFICNTYWDDLSPATRGLIRSTVEHKGIEQFDYLVQSQPDELINNERLAASFLEMYERLDLLAEKQERDRLSDKAAPGSSRDDAPESAAPGVSAEDKKQQTFDMLKSTAESFAEDPEKLAELFRFGSSFYNYSVNNTMLIYAQNPDASFVQSFDAWKGTDSSVKKGQSGIKVLVPVKITELLIDGQTIRLKDATAKQKQDYKAGLIEGRERLAFKIGNVFDISQTTFPLERYPELYSMGYPSEQQDLIVKGLTDFSKAVLDCPVEHVDMQSITLRGLYFHADNKIHLNELMDDTEKLSTLAHELGHAMVHRRIGADKSNAQIEFEADAVGIMIQAHCGIEPSDLRKGHLATNFKALVAELEANPATAADVLKHSQNIFSSVFDTFKSNIDPMQEHIRQHLPDKPELVQTQVQTELRMEGLQQ